MSTSYTLYGWHLSYFTGKALCYLRYKQAPFKLKDIWALRVRLQMEGRVRELALFNLGIDSKLRGCDLVALKVRDVCHGDQVAMRQLLISVKPA